MSGSGMVLEWFSQGHGSGVVRRRRQMVWERFRPEWFGWVVESIIARVVRQRFGFVGRGRESDSRTVSGMVRRWGWPVAE